MFFPYCSYKIHLILYWLSPHFQLLHFNTRFYAPWGREYVFCLFLCSWELKSQGIEQSSFLIKTHWVRLYIGHWHTIYTTQPSFVQRFSEHLLFDVKDWWVYAYINTHTYMHVHILYTCKMSVHTYNDPLETMRHISNKQLLSTMQSVWEAESSHLSCWMW